MMIYIDDLAELLGIPAIKFRNELIKLGLEQLENEALQAQSHELIDITSYDMFSPPPLTINHWQAAASKLLKTAK